MVDACHLDASHILTFFKLPAELRLRCLDPKCASLYLPCAELRRAVGIALADRRALSSRRVHRTPPTVAPLSKNLSRSACRNRKNLPEGFKLRRRPARTILSRYFGVHCRYAHASFVVKRGDIDTGERKSDDVCVMPESYGMVRDGANKVGTKSHFTYEK